MLSLSGEKGDLSTVLFTSEPVIRCIFVEFYISYRFVAVVVVFIVVAVFP